MEQRICEKCLKECPKGIWNKTYWGRIEDVYWNVCTPCYDELLEIAHGKCKKSYWIEEITEQKEQEAQSLKKEIGRFHKLFGRFYIRL